MASSGPAGSGSMRIPSSWQPGTDGALVLAPTAAAGAAPAGLAALAGGLAPQCRYCPDRRLGFVSADAVLEGQRGDARNRLRVGAPEAGGIDVHLDRVAVRVVEVDALRHRVILDRVDRDAERVEVLFGPAKIIDRVAHLESDMVQTGAVRRRVRRAGSQC